MVAKESQGVVAKESQTESEEDEWITHHIGRSGFSVTLPPWWTMDPSEDDMVLFQSGDRALFIEVEDADPDFDLGDVVKRQLDSIGESSDEFDGISPRDHENGRSYVIDYTKYDSNGRGIVKCRDMHSLMRCPTGSWYYQAVGIEMVEGSVEYQRGLDTTFNLFLSGF